MTYRNSEEKLKDIAGIRKGVDDMILSAWERGYKLGLLDGEKRARETMIELMLKKEDGDKNDRR